MDPSILTVVESAPQLLTSLANVKAELSITDTSSDALLTRYISVASDAASAYCRRTFFQQTYEEVTRASPFVDSASLVNQPYFLLLRARPLVSVTQIILDADIAGAGPLVEGTDFEVDYEAGQVYRLWSDLRMRWFFRMVDITYVAGYDPEAASGAPTALPAAVEQATILLVKDAWFSRLRDPRLKSENAQGVYSASWTPGDEELPTGVRALLDPYVSTRFW